MEVEEPPNKKKRTICCGVCGITGHSRNSAKCVYNATLDAEASAEELDALWEEAKRTEQ